MLPWRALGVVLKQAPAVLAAADALLIGSRQRRDAANAAGALESLRERVAALEQQQQATAQLAKELAEHATIVARATQAAAEKTRQAFILAILAVTLAFSALLVAGFVLSS